MRAFAIPLSAAALLVTACGSGSGDGEDRKAQRTPTPSASASTGGASPDPSPSTGSGVARARRVITGWSDALRRSDVDRATGFFSVPLVISQGQAAQLGDRAAVRAFNESLPCGSKVTGVQREGDYFVASFVLTERPGQRCDGPGNTARVAFKLRGDRIREWRQLVERAPAEDLESS